MRQTLVLFHMRFITRIMRAFFALLYHPFAFTYDFVAATVSFGRWKEWIQTVLPFVEGPRILELGFGPGHLQRIMRERNLFAFGLDESRQMTSLAKQRLTQSGYAQINLTRGLAQSLPFPSDMFNTIVSTFPSEYIFNARALAEISRCLLADGKLVVAPLAWITGKKIIDRSLAALFRITGETPAPVETIKSRLQPIFLEAGYRVRFEQVEVGSSEVLIVIAEKA